MMIAIAADILLGGLFWYKNDHFCGATSAENQGGISVNYAPRG